MVRRAWFQHELLVAIGAFDKPLGAPKGDAVQTGWTFRREFQHASVFVDLEKRIGKINWKKK